VAVVVATRWPSRSMILTPSALRAGSRDLGMTEVRTPSLARRHLSNIEAGPSEPMREHLKPDQAGIAHLSCVEMPDTLT
jgi:hypothetical protein